MTPTLADEIEALAKEAFGGDWTVCVEEFGPHKGAVYIHAHDVDADEDGLARDYGRRICDMADNEDDEANAAFIAYCHQHKRKIVSALRELDALRLEVERLREAILWACGVHGDFPGSGDPSRGRFFWRTELRERAGISGEEMNARAALGGGG